jgi:hypothetical protein
LGPARAVIAELQRFGLIKKKAVAIEVLLAKIDECKGMVPEDTKHLAGRMFDALSNAVRNQWTKEHIKNFEGQIAQGETHEAFIYNYVVHTCGNILESGKVHVYRGVLNDEGRQYLELFNHAITRMISLGGYTKDWADANLRAPVLKGISEMG